MSVIISGKGIKVKDFGLVGRGGHASWAGGVKMKIVRATGRSPLRIYLIEKPGGRNGSAGLKLESFPGNRPLGGWGGWGVPEEFLRKF